MNTMLKGKVALVTGGSRGIGLAIAKKMHSLGAAVVIVGRDENALKSACDSMKDGTVLALKADMRNHDEIRAAVEEVENRFHQIDMLFNCAGVSQSRNVSAVDYEFEDYKRIMETNVDGLMIMTREVLKIMRRRDSGYIINILSTAAYSAKKGVGIYAASKYAARALTEALIEECRGSGIRVSSISPGPTASDIWSHKVYPVPQERKDKMLKTDDIADIAAFLVLTDSNVHIGNITVTPWKWED